LLAHTEAIIDKIIVNYQLECEFKRNRQAAILEGMQELKTFIDSGAGALTMLQRGKPQRRKNLRWRNRKTSSLRARYVKEVRVFYWRRRRLSRPEKVCKKFHDIMQVTRLLTVFDVYDTQAAAVSSFQAAKATAG
jgi:hypothetical protein